MDETKETRPFKHEWNSIYMNLQAVAGCTGPTQIKVRWGPINERGKWTWAFIPNEESICN